MTYRLVEVSIKDDLTSLLVILLVYVGLSDDSRQASFRDDCIRICTGVQRLQIYLGLGVNIYVGALVGTSL